MLRKGHTIVIYFENAPKFLKFSNFERHFENGGGSPAPGDPPRSAPGNPLIETNLLDFNYSRALRNVHHTK